MSISSLLIIILSGINITSVFVIPITIKYIINLIILTIIFFTESNLKENPDEAKAKTFNHLIYLYLIGIVLGGILNNRISSSIIYSSLFFGRHILIYALSRKLDMIKIFDSFVFGVSLSNLIGLIFDRKAFNLLISFFSFSLDGIADNRLLLYGNSPNFLGVNVGILVTYMITRLLIEQFKLYEIEFKNKNYFNYNSILGYSIIFFNLVIIFLTNPRAAYLGIFFGNLPIFIKILQESSFKNIYSKYYALFFLGLLTNFENFFRFLSNFVFLQNDKYRGTQTGLTGRFDIWGEKLSSLGPLGKGYEVVIFDNNYLYSIHLSGLLFALPLIIIYFNFLLSNIKLLFERVKSKTNYFQASLKTPLIIYILLMMFFDQQTIGQTSVIAYFYTLIPLSYIPTE